MIVLDTNVLSELMRRQPDAGVLRWVDRIPTGEMFITAITAAELHYGVARLPEGRRRSALAARVSEMLDDDFRDRMLPFGRAAAEYYAEVTAGRDRAGRPIGMADAQIAAICRVHGGRLATRNTKDFVGAGLVVIDPWVAAESG